MRLAYEQGLLRGNSLSQVQYWALLYHIIMQERIAGQDRSELIRSAAMVFSPRRFRKVYLEPILRHNPYPEDEEGSPITPHDYDEIDRYIEQLENQRTASAADIGENEGWM